MTASEKPLPKLKKKQWTKPQLQLPKVAFGREGEARAMQFLQDLKYTILDQNVEIAGVEVDIVAFDSEFREVVFVEVKARANSSFGDPSQAVSFAKIRKMNQVARSYLQEHRRFENYRLDVIAISGRGETAKIDHFQNISWQ